MSNVIDLRSRVEPKLIRGAWTDEEFRTRLLENPTAAYSSVMQEAGGELPTGTEVKALAEEPKKLYLVIPAGDVPDDLEVEVDERSSRGEFEASIILRAKRDEKFKEQLLADAKGTYEGLMGELREGASLPEELEIEALEETGNVIYFRLPQTPEGISDELTDEELEQAAGGKQAAVVAACVAASTVCVGVAVAVALL